MLLCDFKRSERRQTLWCCGARRPVRRWFLCASSCDFLLGFRLRSEFHNKCFFSNPFHTGHTQHAKRSVFTDQRECQRQEVEFPRKNAAFLHFVSGVKMLIKLFSWKLLSTVFGNWTCRGPRIIPIDLFRDSTPLKENQKRMFSVSTVLFKKTCVIGRTAHTRISELWKEIWKRREWLSFLNSQMKSHRNHTPLSHVLICLLDSKFGYFQRILLGTAVLLFRITPDPPVISVCLVGQFWVRLLTFARFVVPARLKAVQEGALLRWNACFGVNRAVRIVFTVCAQSSRTVQKTSHSSWLGFRLERARLIQGGSESQQVPRRAQHGDFRSCKHPPVRLLVTCAGKMSLYRRGGQSCNSEAARRSDFRSMVYNGAPSRIIQSKHIKRSVFGAGASFSCWSDWKIWQVPQTRAWYVLGIGMKTKTFCSGSQRTNVFGASGFAKSGFISRDVHPLLVTVHFPPFVPCSTQPKISQREVRLRVCSDWWWWHQWGGYFPWKKNNKQTKQKRPFCLLFSSGQFLPQGVIVTTRVWTKHFDGSEKFQPNFLCVSCPLFLIHIRFLH